MVPAMAVSMAPSSRSTTCGAAALAQASEMMNNPSKNIKTVFRRIVPSFDGCCCIEYKPCLPQAEPVLRGEFDRFGYTCAVLPQGGAQCNGDTHLMSIRVVCKCRRADREALTGVQHILGGGMMAA